MHDTLQLRLCLRQLLLGGIELTLELGDQVLVLCLGLGQLGNLILTGSKLALQITGGSLPFLLAARELICSAFKRFLHACLLISSMSQLALRMSVLLPERLLHLVHIVQMHRLHVGSHLHCLLLQALCGGRESIQGLLPLPQTHIKLGSCHGQQRLQLTDALYFAVQLSLQIMGDALQLRLRVRQLLLGSLELALKQGDLAFVLCLGIGQLGNLLLA